MNGFSAVLLLAVAGLTNAYLDQGNCPSIKHVDEFDLPSYMGRWFETQRYPDGIEKGRACVTADYVLVNDTRFSIRNSANLHDGSIELLHGNAVTTDTPGRFIVGFQGEPPIVYNVLATDYATYSSVYSCAEGEDYREQFAWVLSRTERLDPDAIAAALDAFDSNNIDTSVLQVTPQGGHCVYTSPPPKV